MKRFLSAALLLLSAFSTLAQTSEPVLNGLAAYTQLRKEYYIGGLFLGWPGRDSAAIANMPGKKRMELRVTADRWPPLRFAQQWNQLILINNDSALLNANVMDVLAFTGIPKGDLVEGDRLTIEFEPDAGTVVSLNGQPVVRTGSAALFTMLLNTWIGPRPPSSEFKRDILNLPKDPAGVELASRFESLHPSDARKKAVAAWGGKAEPEPAALASAEANKAKPAPAPAKVEADTKPRTEAKVPAPTPAPAQPARVATAENPHPAAAPQPDNSAQQAQKAREEHEKTQVALYNDYLAQIRRQVNKNTEYPRRAVKEGIEGLVVLRVQLDRLGNLLGMELAQSAHDVLDRAAESAVKSALPFPPAADQLEGSQFQFLVPIVFKLTK